MKRWQLPENGFSEINGAHLEFATFGAPPSEAPTIVMLHEGLGSVSHWKNIPERLASETGLGVFVYSRAGYGQSSPIELPRPMDYMTREAIDVLPMVLDASGFQEGILLGHSDGATIAAIYAGTVKDLRVSGLVLIAPHFFAEDMGLVSIAEAKSAYRTGDLKEKLRRHHKNVDNAFCGWSNAWLDPGFREWNVSEVVDGLSIPVLTVQGRDDPYGTLAQIEEIKTRACSQIDVEILDNCGHSPYREQPEKFLKIVAEFFSRISSDERNHVGMNEAQESCCTPPEIQRNLRV